MNEKNEIINWFGDNFFMVAFVGMFLIFSLILMHENCEEKESDWLMDQCLADGHKEYECVSMLKRGRVLDRQIKKK